MKRFRKDNVEVEAVQFDGTEETLNEIKELLGDKADTVDETDDLKTFSLIGRKKSYTIFRTDWIVKDHYYFVVSNDVFETMFTEIEE